MFFGFFEILFFWTFFSLSREIVKCQVFPDKIKKYRQAPE